MTETVAVAAVDATLDTVKTIQVRADTKRKLDSIGRKGDTYDMIICKLIEAYLTVSGRFPSSLAVASQRLPADESS